MWGRPQPHPPTIHSSVWRASIALTTLITTLTTSSTRVPTRRLTSSIRVSWTVPQRVQQVAQEAAVWTTRVTIRGDRWVPGGTRDTLVTGTTCHQPWGHPRWELRREWWENITGKLSRFICPTILLYPSCEQSNCYHHWFWINTEYWYFSAYGRLIF